MQISVMKQIIALCILISLMATSMVTFADEIKPDELIKNVAQEVLSIVKQDNEIKGGNTKKTVAMIDAKILPNFDFERMTRLAVGMPWRNATAEQKKTLVAEFRHLLVRTYANVFTKFDNQTLQVEPLHIPLGADTVNVKTHILKPGAKPIDVDYEMEKTPDGWKVFDLTVEGVSLITNYRGTFSEQAANGGINGLIKTLTDKNAANDASQ